MSEDKREVIQLEKRATIDKEDLEKAFDGCEEVFWAKALEYFPEIESGDTEPMATMTYSETVKAFMKHWLELNARIMVDGLTEANAEALAETVAEGRFNFAGDDGDFLIATEGSPDPLNVRVVEIQHDGKPQGYAVEVLDVVDKTSRIARNEFQLEFDIERATEEITKRIDS